MQGEDLGGGHTNFLNPREPNTHGSPEALKTQGLICVLLAEKFGSYGVFLSLNSEHFKTVFEVQYFPGVFRIY